MAAEHNHLSLSITGSLASTQSSQSQSSVHILQQQPSDNASPSSSQDGSLDSSKRGPGRPRGSTKKSLEVTVDPASQPKLKRPVGRPRKDGRPAGSVPKVPRGPGRPRKHVPADFSINTFPQQQPLHGEPEVWSGLTGVFNHYRLSKETVTESSAPAAVNDTVPAANPATPATAIADTPSQQPNKWFTSPSTAQAATSSSSSIAGALIPPHSQNPGPGHSENATTTPALVPNASLEPDKTPDDASSRPSGEASLSIPIPQIVSFILATVYSLFSRQSHRNSMPLPRDVLLAYRAHLGHLSGSQSVAYNFLKTFWLPRSPLLFRMVLPRTGQASKLSHRNSQSFRSSGSTRPAPNGANVTSTNGDAPNPVNRMHNQDHHYDAHRFFYWDPLHLSLGGPIACPVCSQAPLLHSGPIRSGPLRVFDLPCSSMPATSAHVHAGLVPSVFYVIGMQYSCSESTCGSRFASWDPRIVNALPQFLAEEWPVHLPSIPTEQSENKSGWSGDAISRPLFALVKTLAQVGISQENIRDVLSKAWDWGESEQEDVHMEESENEEAADQENNGKIDTEKVTELFFSSPYQRLWTAQASEAAVNVPLTNGSGERPTKRRKQNEPTSGGATIMSVPATDFGIPLFSPPNGAGADGSSTGLSIQLQAAPEHRPQGTDGLQAARLQPPGQLKSNPPTRQQGPRASISHAHIHTPSPIYPPTSLPNSTTNSPQTGQGGTLSLKRPLEPDTHPPQAGAGAAPPPPIAAPPPPGAAASQGPFPALVHASPFQHLRVLQQHAAAAHQAPLPQHAASVRPEHAMHMHPGIVQVPPGAMARFNTQAALRSHASSLLTATAPQAAPPQPQPQTQPPQQAPAAPAGAQRQPQAPPHPTPQRRVRHCVKCGRNDCKGKGGSQFCKNPCKDCHRMNCKGRNSKRPNATCRDGW